MNKNENFIFEFLSNQKIILVECNNSQLAQLIVTQKVRNPFSNTSEIILLKSIYRNLEHYSFLNKNFPKYFTKSEFNYYKNKNCINIYSLN